MKLLLDQGLPRSSASLLRAAGIDAVHTGEIGLATAEDAFLLEQARLEKRIIITLDADFHALLALSQASYPSVVRIRIQGLKADHIVTLLLSYLPGWEEMLTAGAVMTVQHQRVRVRKLPLTGKAGS